jgi:hypothetical protein
MCRCFFSNAHKILTQLHSPIRRVEACNCHGCCHGKACQFVQAFERSLSPLFESTGFDWDWGR